MTDTRNTKYTDAVRAFMTDARHATNAQILAELQRVYPELSATTIHRITARMHERGELGIAPPAHDGATQYDAQAAEHDHFYCTCCKQLHDITLPADCIKNLESSLSGCKVTGRLTIHGSCGKCIK